MKDNVKVKVPNNPQGFNSFGWGGKLGWGVEIGNRLEGDHATHF
jgi:hypothetical protein